MPYDLQIMKTWGGYRRVIGPTRSLAALDAFQTQNGGTYRLASAIFKQADANRWTPMVC